MNNQYKMTIGLNVLNHLGIKLYSSIPAVLSEVVANAWDADATEVNINIEKDKIIIEDNGHGMSSEDINSKYLFVGYDKRKDVSQTQTYKRKVMGRKGIGKLSLFSIANNAIIETYNGQEKNGFILSYEKITALLKGKTGEEIYNPEPLEKNELILKNKGTKIVLTQLKKNINSVSINGLKKRIARRFSIIGTESFTVKINGQKIGVEDRDYFYKIQYLWYFGDESKKYIDFCDKQKLEKINRRSGKINILNESYLITGWIGTVVKSGDLKDEDDNLNKIIIMVRGKLAQEDIIEDFPEGGLYTKYLIGEIHADFLDLDDEEDIATTNRQEINKDEPRYKALRDFLQTELKNIQREWTNNRNESGVRQAIKIEAIKEWFDSLKPKTKQRAEKLFGKINELTVDDASKKELFKHAIIAFESLKYKDNLDAIEHITPENIHLFKEIFSEYDDIEATLYHQIIKARISVIKTLHENIDNNAKEKIVQDYLYENLWLLEPSWDRGTETPFMEKSVKSEFGKIDAKLTDEEKRGRFDIKYKTSAGKHIIIELKRANRELRTTEIIEQLNKYTTALEKSLDAVNLGNEQIECICIVGKALKEWSNDKEKQRSIDSLEGAKIRVILYQELIENAYRQYSEFLQKNNEVGKLMTLVKSIEDSTEI
jgi:hypothetical protein